MRLHEHKFAAWLRAKPPTEIVGENRDCHSCPIANYYWAATGGHEIVIFDRWGVYFIDRGDGGRRAPAWAADFMSTVDGDENGQITAGRALEILKPALTAGERDA